MLNVLLCSLVLLVFGQATEAESLVVKLEEKMNSGISGEITISQLDTGIKLTGQIKGLKPNSVHGFHVHEKGDCSSEDAESAGGHFNPTNENHGGPQQDKKHAGDFGNIEANSQGVAQIDIKRSKKSS